MISCIRSLEVDIKEKPQHIKELKFELQHTNEANKALLFLNEKEGERLLDCHIQTTVSDVYPKDFILTKRSIRNS